MFVKHDLGVKESKVKPASPSLFKSPTPKPEIKQQHSKKKKFEIPITKVYDLTTHHQTISEDEPDQVYKNLIFSINASDGLFNLSQLFQDIDPSELDILVFFFCNSLLTFDSSIKEVPNHTYQSNLTHSNIFAPYPILMSINGRK